MQKWGTKFVGTITAYANCVCLRADARTHLPQKHIHSIRNGWSVEIAAGESHADEQSGALKFTNNHKHQAPNISISTNNSTQLNRTEHHSQPSQTHARITCESLWSQTIHNTMNPSTRLTAKSSSSGSGGFFFGFSSPIDTIFLSSADGISVFALRCTESDVTAVCVVFYGFHSTRFIKSVKNHRVWFACFEISAFLIGVILKLW